MLIIGTSTRPTIGGAICAMQPEPTIKPTRHDKANNTSGFKGVTVTPKGRYVARIKARSKHIHLGVFDTPEQAHAAYCQAANTHFGEFARYA
ncbi:hypothetical protein FJ949_09790 [Mesorhizobium sp. B2-4-1]|nr:hypothetical protein FJ949_09790 [Mesorhizobium sp. B2-4-1]